MTNSEYFEKNKIPFTETMEIFNKQKDKGIKSFDTFLNAERTEWKFRPGDLVVVQLNKETHNDGWKHNVVLEILRTVQDGSILEYVVKLLTPNYDLSIGDTSYFEKDFLERNCVRY